MSLQAVQELQDWNYKHLTLTDNHGLASVLTKVPEQICPRIVGRGKTGVNQPESPAV